MAGPRKAPRHHLREWRKHRGLTLEQLAERVDMTHQNLGKIERGLVPYNQFLLERLAEELRASPAQLINVDPTRGEDAIWSIYETLTPVQREQATKMLQVIQGGRGDRTGTDD